MAGVLKRTPLRRTSRLAPSGPWARSVPLLRDHEKTKIVAAQEAGRPREFNQGDTQVKARPVMDSSAPIPATAGPRDTGSE
jgi:hypothetical protein